MRAIHRLLAFTLMLVASAASAREAAGQSTSIKVQGDWVIDVRNADGSAGSHNEFRNSLFVDGAGVLSNLLAGASLGNRWQVQLSGVSCDVADCILKTTNGNLVARTKSVDGFQKFVLEGQFEATSAGAVTSARARLEVCENGGGAEPCTLRAFSGRDVPQQPIVAGQIVTVSVTYSFFGLFADGTRMLADMLSGVNFGTQWQLRLGGIPCAIVESANEDCVLKVSDGNLRVSVDGQGFVLSGELKSPLGGDLLVAWASLEICDVDAAGVQSCAPRSFSIAGVPLQLRKDISPGQMVQVKVTFKFR